MIFAVLKQSSSFSARTGKLTLNRGIVDTPVFMPVGTSAAVKAVPNHFLNEMGIKIILANTYHLYLRPGIEILQSFSGIHHFQSWQKPILTDSGGFQVFSLSQLSKVKDEGYQFRSHIDGSRHFFSPQKVIEIQNTIGSDIIMPLDQCISYDADEELIKTSVKRTVAWANISKTTLSKIQSLGEKHKQVLFGIVQGSRSKKWRKECLDRLQEIDFAGYAIGGLSVGESKEQMYAMCEYTAQHLPKDKPRYLMGVGAPEDLVEGIASGIDMFDCVLPTRNARNATVYSYEGKLLLKNKSSQLMDEPIDKTCQCYTCQNYSRGYLHHLFKTKEMNAYTLASIHNLYFFERLTADIRQSINKDEFALFYHNFKERYKK